jgi:hypothetical protein
MNERQITITYERKMSDGNYGSEGLLMSLTLDLDAESFAQAQMEGVLLLDLLHDRAIQLRSAVLGELATSAAERVAWAANRELNPPAPRQSAPVPQAAPAAAASGDLEDLPF